jgi:hypothetical protein
MVFTFFAVEENCYFWPGSNEGCTVHHGIKKLCTLEKEIDQWQGPVESGNVLRIVSVWKNWEVTSQKL